MKGDCSDLYSKHTGDRRCTYNPVHPHDPILSCFAAEERRRALEDTVHLFEYMRESADLEQWINEQLQTAMSEEYGDDYEHFKV